MKNVIIALAFMLLLFGCTTQAAPETEEEESVPAPAEETPEETEEPEPDVIPAEELSQHSSVFDCWVLYNGNVYDITAFLPNHANNSIEGIVPHCGLTDESFADAFEAQHGTFKVSVLESEGVFKGQLAEE